jgi:protein SCO1/2
MSMRFRIGVSLMATLGVLILAGCREPEFNGVRFDPPEPAPAVSLSRADGSTFKLQDQRGSVVLVFFGYTHCPDVCPTTLADWKKVMHALGSSAKRVTFVFISVDPARDTPAAVQHYVDGFDPSFVGLSGDSAQVARAESEFHVSASRDDAAAATGYTMTHSSQTFVIDMQNRVRLLYPFGIPPVSIVADVRKLLRNA